MSRAFEVEERVIEETFGNQIVVECEYRLLERLPSEGAAKLNKSNWNRRCDNLCGLIQKSAAVFGKMLM
jgi:hypothetical protein